MIQTNGVYSTLVSMTPDDLDMLTPYLDAATVDDLAFRLTGLSGRRLEAECLWLADAMLQDMTSAGYNQRPLEEAVVMALLRAAMVKAAWARPGHA